MDCSLNLHTASAPVVVVPTSLLPPPALHNEHHSTGLSALVSEFECWKFPTLHQRAIVGSAAKQRLMDGGDRSNAHCSHSSSACQHLPCHTLIACAEDTLALSLVGWTDASQACSRHAELGVFWPTQETHLFSYQTIYYYFIVMAIDFVLWVIFSTRTH